MKVERHTTPGFLWKWLQAHLPASLVTAEIMQGYEVGQYIYRRGRQPGVLSRLFENEGDPIAMVGEKQVTLSYPEYFSDFEDLCRKYEAETGIEITLHYWESPIRKSEAA